MFTISRLNKSRLANWWWTVDKVTLCIVFSIIFIGAFLVFSASPSVARTINVDDYHFIKRQMLFIGVALFVIIFLSMQNLKTIRRLAVVGYVGALVLTLATLFIGFETKGASRWINLFGVSLQPSEFIKPTFVIVSAWLLDGSKKFDEFPGGILSTALFIFTACVLLLQPDVGMTLVVLAIWGFQLFLAGLPMVLVGGFILLVVLGGIGAYFTFDHVHSRVQAFLASGDNLPYQVEKSLKAFENGNLFGKGPGEGVVKLHLPDAHTDFIFAVAGEEFGVWLCAILVILFSIVVLRALILSLKDNNLFVVYASAGLAASFGLQGIINMASTLHLMPTKGMTLPFISYGGSSLLASAICIGMLLAITRKNSSAEDKDM
ncbi:MAG: cell division protein FtsW [Alphaproteobacteria bacterium]|nr:cell division protein FtsW [Alphaproteobacteria bacterium]MBQ2811290.1 cell division protein FtsW [Alphaproteobacteria bacterium]